MANSPIRYAWKRNYTLNRVIPTHSHDFYEFVYYINANGQTEIDGKNYEFHNGSFCILSPGTKHDENHIGTSSVLMVGFEIEEAENINFFSNKESSFIANIVERIEHEIRDKREFYIQMIYNYILEIIIYAKRKVGGYLFKNDSPIDSAISYIDEHYLTNINFNELASRTGYCVDRFRILFKEKLGITPKQYILNKKLLRAKEMLANTDKMFELISFELGFAHYSRFSLFFKEKTGMSPREYRDAHKR